MEKIVTTAKSIEELSHIKGWGVDADPQNDPTYPIKNWTGDDHKRIRWQRPPLQKENVEVLHSIERPNSSATFGTSVPPSGLSGSIRRFAYKYSEASYGHWLSLLLADRVNVVEGLIDDLKRGYVPNIFAERGWKAEWKYNRKRLLRKLAIGALATTAIIGMMRSRKR